MGQGVRHLRVANESDTFRQKRKRLTESEARLVARTIGTLRIAETLPDDDDHDDIIPPCLPVLRRAVPETDLWVYFHVVEGAGGAIFLVTVNSLEQRLTFGPG